MTVAPCIRDAACCAADLHQNRLTLHYQPQVDLLTGHLLGAEALLRWNRPGHGMVPPDRFIGLAEDTGLIVPIGLWVLREACRRAATWPEHIGIAVNVSPVQLRHPGFCEAVINILRETGIAPSRLELEITESRADARHGRNPGHLAATAQVGHQAGDGRFRHGVFQPGISSEIPFRSN
jgi:EAL domain-containing protein (putative c-di-GMP-specific phosphodiesterase class I)